MILTGRNKYLKIFLHFSQGRAVSAQEALQFGLANRIVPKGKSKEEAIKLAQEIAKFPQICARGDRMSAYEQFDLSLEDALKNEFKHGLNALKSETQMGALKFAKGAGRAGAKL
jgi:enoyl-CoA hydratase